MYEFDVQNNHTIATYPGVESFIFGEKRKGVRKAITYLADKDLIVTDCTGGFTERIDQLLAAPHKGWRNQTHPGWGDGNFTFEYDPDTAASILDAEGFVQGTTPNPAYNPALTWSAEFLRVYPGDHPTEAGNDVHPVVMCIRTDDLRRFCAGDLLKYHLEVVGFPTAAIYGSSTELYDQVMGDMNFHIYTGGWSLGRFPPLYQYGLMHESQNYPYGSNYITGMNETNLPNYPELDEVLLEGYTALTYSTAQAAVKKASGIAHYDLCVHIPLWSTASYWAWKCNVKAVVNAEGAGPENGYSFMNMYKTDDTALTYGTIRFPTAMNKFYSSWYYDYQNLNRMDLYGNGITAPPYDLGVDQNAFITEWVTDTFIDPDDATEKSKNTFTYRSDGYAVEPVTGNIVEQLNAHHVYADIWYTYQTPDCWAFSGVQWIDHINITNSDCDVEMYWATLSYWNTYYGGGSAINSLSYLQQSPLSTFETQDIAFAGGTGYVATDEDPWLFEVVTLDGTPLVQGIDWEIYAPTPATGTGGDAQLRILTTQAAGTLHVEYWAVGDARGYTPGNIAWQQSFEGAGAFYATDFVAGAGGYLALAANRQYYMETPPLGEIDFVRKGNDCYKVDIFDVVIVASAYGSTGGAILDSNWFPGADLVPECCKVDIFDVVTVTGKYGLEWDCPPPCP
jgi:hypothetical protein